ncbi:unnamed protein product, partial [Ectocarpus sp. 13 AM-2016]
MNPNITPGSIHIAIRLHHLFKNRHCYCGKTNSSVGQRSTKSCASLTTKKKDRHHHGPHTPIRRGDSFCAAAAHDLSIPQKGERSMMPKAQSRGSVQAKGSSNGSLVGSTPWSRRKYPASSLSQPSLSLFPFAYNHHEPQHHSHNIYIATRLHHRLENSRCYFGKTNSRQFHGPAIN